MISDVLRRKLDSRGRRALTQGKAGDTVECLIRTNEPVTHAMRTELSNAGCTARTATGAVLSAVADAKRLDEVAQLPFVLRIELSRDMFEELNNQKT